MKAGYSPKGITIIDDMLKKENLIVDPITSEKNFINLDGNKISPNLNKGVVKGNNKVIYKNGQIYWRYHKYIIY